MKNNTQQTNSTSNLFSIKSFFINNWLILSSFILFSIFNVIIFLRYGWLFGAQDLQFHLQRIEELYQNSQHLNFFPSIATFTFNQNGSAVMSMYPKLPLYLFVACRLIIQQPIISYYVGIILMTFIGMVVAYFCYLSVERGKKIGAYIFAIIYMMSGLIVNYNFYMGDIGISFSLIFLPLAFTGLFHWISTGKYKMLTLGISLICLSHVLNVIFVIVTMIIFTLINIQKLSKAKIVNLLKSIGITILITSSFWLPALSFGTSTKMVKPYNALLQGINIPDYLLRSLSNNVTYGITFFAVLGLVLGSIYYRRLPTYIRQALWVAIGYFLISSNLFPWKIFQHTGFRLIQFPWRLLIFTQLFLVFIFSYLISRLLEQSSHKQINGLITAMLIIVTVALSLNTQQRHLKFELGAPEISAPLDENYGIGFKNTVAWYKITNKYEYHHLMAFNSTGDYLPQNAFTVFKQIASKSHFAALHSPDGLLPTTLKSGADQSTISFQTSQITNKIELPFVIYNHHYQIKLDSKKIPLNISKHQLLLIKNVKAGTHTVHVQYKNNAITIAVALMTVAGLIAIIYVPKKHHSV
ncbi:hypothetical protein GQR93_13815 [Lentilactobacillus hilgardii]|uniref:Membrane protein 6-pyruvoyl-tetrahydropterin synthase-related domain-containing protein n=3 Tax=Lentilactobacillus hilgardii TaxID=1588 RepID=A0A6P1E710_LENHI|nr:hypothetical protein [Lentilactobacillus hilgardii]EEI72598.1 hypothetical protein HMPREF0496_0150 [Lentilactobacillus hilgardii ATCC 27305]MCT3391291.1 hypothetical protein [Lentilactobacillus hilgardii]QHB53186.1 hypothetical protein GQR93_13815 [Lentilactobacillus hilgardii]RRG11292.1 MAG: hypothetical protein DUD35_07355 [Lactobacillus sp.]